MENLIGILKQVCSDDGQMENYWVLKGMNIDNSILDKVYSSLSKEYFKLRECEQFINAKGKEYMQVRGYTDDDLWQYNYATPRVSYQLSMKEGIMLYKFLWCIGNNRIRIDKYNFKINKRAWMYFNELERRLANEITYQIAFN